ncbi:MAG TPA: hypothetical protein VL961_05900, partial [Acidimicrobiales bacterium]|nr:hypothetical protein [Acidimicrobiales bacterium]
GLGLQLEPGQSSNIPIVGGTARCDGARGSALPAGLYAATTEVTGIAVTGSGGGATPAPPTLYTPPVEVRVT